MLRIVSYCLIGLISIGLVLGFSLSAAPYYYYYKVVNQGENVDWFSLDNRVAGMEKPDPARDLKVENVENEGLWSKFHFKNHLLPIPVSNPYFFVAPIFNFDPKSKTTNLGISISNASKSIISQVYFLPRFEIPQASRGQRLFEFPVIANEMKNYELEKVWIDLFSKDLTKWKISTDEMIYNLYLLEIRSKLFDENLEKFYFLKDEKKAITQMKYQDKDYISEIVFSRRATTVYPILILTLKGNEEAQKIRYKVIKDLEFLNTTSSLADILYQEFKNLSFKKKIDHEGMLYLLSAWSHTPSNKELLIEAINFLERGTQNQKQLEAFYSYMYKRFGKTFARREINGLNLDFEVLLKLRQEVESYQIEVKELRKAPTPVKRKTISEEYDDIIDQTKDKIKKSKKRIRMN